jgi:zinc transport system substrate-binding protein
MRRTIAALCLLASPAFAQEPPNVVVDISPIRSLVAQIMDGVGAPSQIIPTGASPHGYAMRPSEARALSAADLVVWVGPALTHWLEEPLDTLSADAARLTLMALEGAKELPMRDAEMLEEQKDDHDHAEEEGRDHGGDDHAKEEEGHDHEGHDHAKEEEEHAGHDHGDHAHHGDVDPHGWLSPANAVLWSGAIAQKLGEIDPANAEAYATNAQAFSDEMKTVEAELSATLAPYSDTPFVVLHDAFHYFEDSFGVEAESFIIPGSGATPGPARMQALRAHLAENPVACAFTAPQENEGLLRTATEGQDLRVAVLDPLGDGEMRYSDFMRAFATAMVECFEGR